MTSELLQDPARGWPARCHWMLAIALLLSAAATACAGAADHDDDDHAQEVAHTEGEVGEEDTVVLDSTGIRLAGIRVAAAESVTDGGLTVTGTVTYDANRVSHVGARIDGRIVALRADIGQRVAVDQVLARLESVEVGRLRAEERQAEALVRIAEEHYAREQRLERQGIASRKELLVAEAELRRAEAAWRSADEGLRVLGAGHGVGGEFVVVAPFAGAIVEREASLGEVASPADRLFTVADLSRVWIELDIFERDLARVRPEQQAVVTVVTYPGRTFPGRVTYLGDLVNPVTQTVRARVEVLNPDGALKPGMFARAQIRVGADGTSFAAVPEGAVQELEGRKVVFVPGDHPGEFRAVAVEIGDLLDGGRVVIRAGLAPGTQVVVAGAFTLRAELAKGDIGHHSH